MKKLTVDSMAAYGREMSERIHLNALAYRGFLGLLGLDGERLKRAVGTAFDAINKSAPSFVCHEIYTLATGAGISPEEIILLNARSEMLSIWANWSTHECTSVGVAAERSEDGFSHIAQNWDWLTVMRSLPVVVNVKPLRGLPYVTFCEAGQLAKIGVNEAGLAVGLNFLEVPRGEVDLAKSGLPIHILIRVVLGERTVSDAVERLRSLPRGGAANLVLADAQGGLCCAEIRPSRVDVIEPRDGLVTHANDFESGFMQAVRSTRLREILSNEKGITKKTLFSSLRDHRGTEPICSHPDAPLASSTIASIVVDTVKPTLWVSHGTPCDSLFACERHPVSRSVVDGA